MFKRVIKRLGLEVAGLAIGSLRLLILLLVAGGLISLTGSPMVGAAIALALYAVLGAFLKSRRKKSELG